MKRIIDGYHALLTWLMVASVAVLIVPVTLQIISRYTALIPSWIWTEELSRFLFIWMIMLGAMIGVREGSHFVVDVLPDLPPRAPAGGQRGAADRSATSFVLLSAWLSAGWGKLWGVWGGTNPPQAFPPTR